MGLGMGMGMGMGNGSSSSSSSSSAVPNAQQQQQQQPQLMPNDAAPTMSLAAMQHQINVNKLSPQKNHDPTRGKIKDGFRRSSLPGPGVNKANTANLGTGMLTVEKEKHRQSRIFDNS